MISYIPIYGDWCKAPCEGPWSGGEAEGERTELVGSALEAEVEVRTYGDVDGWKFENMHPEGLSP